MDFKELLLKSLRIAWGHKWLWVFGFFAGGTTLSPNIGNSVNWRTSSPTKVDPRVSDWISQNLNLVVGVAILAALFAVFFIALSIIAQGALIRAASDLDEEKEGSFSAAFGAGLASFWRLLGFVLLIWLIVLIPLIMIVGPLVLAIVTLNGALLVLAGLLVFMLILALIPLSIIIAVVTAFGSRSVVLQGHGARQALKDSLRLIQKNAGQSFVVWVISFGLTIAFSFMFIIVMLVLLIPLVVAGYFIFMDGITLPGIGAMSFIGLVFLAFIVTVLSGFRAWLSTFWTLAYKSLTAAPADVADDTDEGSGPFAGPTPEDF